LRAIHHRIAAPLVTELRVLDVADVAPQPIPDLFPGAPLLLTGRVTGDVDTVTVVGKDVNGAEWRRTLTAHPSDNPALGAIWARARIRDLEDQYAIGDQDQLDRLAQRIVATSLEFGVLSRFTAFVAVDSRVVTEGGRPRQVTQPVDLPATWAVLESAPILAAGGPVAFGAAAAPARGRTRAKRTHVRRELSRSMPQAPIPDPVREFAERAKKKLLESASLGLSERINALDELAESIGAALPEFVAAGLGQWEVLMLTEFAATRATPIADEDDLVRRWARAIGLLEHLTGTKTPSTPRRPFWKR
jgi:Ca-activated chloride channel family protein